MNDLLLARFEEFRDAEALIWRGQSYRYQDLTEAVTKWRARLDEFGLRGGESVAIVGDYSPETCALFLSLTIAGNVIVPLAPNREETRDRWLDVAGVSALFEFGADDRWTFTPREATSSHPLLEKLRAAGEAGLVLFTSGSTGESKASLLSLNRFLEKFVKRRSAYRTLIFLKLDHIGGINTLLHVLCDGGTLISIAERTPQAVAAAIELHRVELLPTTPTFLNMLLISGAAQEHDLSSLKMITYGTEPMPASTLRRLHEVFPNIRLKQTYGLSELGILPTISRDSQSLWIKLGGEGYETKVVDGILWVRTRSAMLGYLNAPDPFDAEGWFKTGDMVKVEGDYLRILGRASEVINVGGEKVYPAEVESVLLQMENVREATVFGKSNPVTGKIVVARISLHMPEDQNHFTTRMREFCKGRLADFQVPMIVVLTDADHHSARFKKQRGPLGLEPGTN